MIDLDFISAINSIIDFDQINTKNFNKMLGDFQSIKDSLVEDLLKRFCQEETKIVFNQDIDETN